MTCRSIAAALSCLTLTAGRPAPVPPAPPPAARPSRGTLIRVDDLGSVDRATLARHIEFLPTPIPVAGGVELYRIVYWTEDRGAPAKASGLLAIPEHRSDLKGVVVYLHGTNIPRAGSPSMPDRVDGNEEAAIFAGNGYYTVLPDYLGLGESPGPQSYLVLRPQVAATIDLLRAVRHLTRARGWPWPPALFLMGFSQGGQVLAGVQRELEQRPAAGLTLAGSAAVAGAYDLRAVTIPFALRQGGVEMLGFVAFAAASYARYYGHPFDDVFAPPYATELPRLFDGSHDLREIAGAFPEDPRQMFHPGFLRSIEEDNWFTRALEANSVTGWIPRRPMRLFFGEDDHNVSPDDSRRFQAYAASRGAPVTAESLGQVDHQGSLSGTYPLALRWFDSLAVAIRR